jgi:hypothetical protein
MIVKHARPPMFEEIAAALPMAREDGVMFCWGVSLYVPDGRPVPPSLLQAHEPVHSARQLKMGVEKWWQRYIVDPAFRLAEEIPAHRAEYQWWVNAPEGRDRKAGFRCKADYMLFQIAQRLSSPLYGRLVSIFEAKRLISAP